MDANFEYMPSCPTQSLTFATYGTAAGPRLWHVYGANGRYMLAKADSGSLPPAAWGKPLDIFREHVAVEQTCSTGENDTVDVMCSTGETNAVDLTCSEQLDADEETNEVDLVCSEQLDAGGHGAPAAEEPFDLARMMIPMPTERMPPDIPMDMDLGMLMA